MIAWFAILLQQQRETILPRTASEWVSLIVQTIAICTVVGGVLWRQIVGKVNGVGERANTNAVEIAKLQTITTEHEKKLLSSEFDRAKIHEDIGRLTANVDRFVAASDGRRDKDAERDQAILERLTRIEERSSVSESITELGEIVAQAIREVKK